MTTYNLIKRDGCYYVQGLRDDWCDSDDTMLICRYPEGDCDTISRNGKNMHRALYDLLQTCELLHEGDEFAIAGKVAYRCSGVHVVKA
jgi:hypothetical protein